MLCIEVTLTGIRNSQRLESVGLVRVGVTRNARCLVGEMADQRAEQEQYEHSANQV